MDPRVEEIMRRHNRRRDKSEPGRVGPLIMSSRDFVAGDYVAPQYLIEGIMQQRRIYSLTGKTGDGKTALQLYVAYLLATARQSGAREVEQCRVLYLAGENPDDVRRDGSQCRTASDFDADAIEVHFVEGVVFGFGRCIERVAEEAKNNRRFRRRHR